MTNNQANGKVGQNETISSAWPLHREDDMEISTSSIKKNGERALAPLFSAPLSSSNFEHVSC